MKLPIPSIFLIAVTSWLGACSTVPPSHPGTSATAVVGDDQLPQKDDPKAIVRYGETVKRYPVGPYIDPNHPEIRHDRHWIARVKQGPSWNLQPVPVGEVMPGPADDVSDPAAMPNPYLAEFETELARQRQAADTIIAQSEAMAGRLKVLNQQAEANQAIAENNEQLARELTAAKAQIQSLQQEVAGLKSPPPAPKSGSWWPW